MAAMKLHFLSILLNRRPPQIGDRDPVALPKAITDNHHPRIPNSDSYVSGDFTISLYCVDW